jgi:hypothetical protein
MTTRGRALSQKYSVETMVDAYVILLNHDSGLAEHVSDLSPAFVHEQPAGR